jgi:signal transduction histidine kinase
VETPDAEFIALHPLDPDLLLSIGQLAQAHGPDEIAKLLDRVVVGTTSAASACLLAQEDEAETKRPDTVGGTAILENRRLAITTDELSRWPNEPLIGKETSAIMAWPMGTEEVAAAMVVSWSGSNTPTEMDVRMLECLAEIVRKTLERFHLWSEMDVLAESRTQSIQSVNEELETFAYTMSHDLKTPLTIMKTSIWAVRQLIGAQLDARGALTMNRLESTVERMRGQVEGMLHMYSLTKDELRPREIDISAVSREILDGLQSQAPTRRLSCEIAPDLVVRGDPTMLTVVMENLLDNAWKYTARKAETVIQVGASLDENGGQAIFVKDNGAGFNSENAERLFGVFQRLHTDEDFEGSGIGLASVQRIINKHGGRVWAESQLGQGARFYFTLPDELPSDDHSADSLLSDA